MLLRMINTDLSMLKDPGFLMTGKKYRLGRSSKCAFVINDLSVSRYHAELSVNDASLVVKDLGSLNGTFIGGTRVTDGEIKPGDTVVFGSVRFHLAGHDAIVPPNDDHSDVSTAVYNGPAADMARERALLNELSDKHRRVLQLLLQGLPEKSVAAALCMSPHTVHNYVKAIYRALRVNSRAELLALYRLSFETSRGQCGRLIPRV